MKERWKNIKGWEGIYQISNCGRMKSFKVKKSGYILSNVNKTGGYLSVVLQSKYRPRQFTRIHHLVAEAFILNPDNLPEVNHKDTNKQNNRQDNLEWVTRAINARHAIKHNPNIIAGMNHYNRFIRPRSIIQYSLGGRQLAIFQNSIEAFHATGICHRNILQVASKDEYRPGLTRKQAGGFVWKFKDTA